MLVSLLAEPLAGVADTAFVARLGPAPLAALGIATTALSSVFWIFNFLGIGAQTEVSQAVGRGAGDRARRAGGLALALAALAGAGVAVLAWPLLPALARFMGDVPAVREATVAYLQPRLLGAPAVLIQLTAFGVLRGLLDMRTPLRIALATALLNVALDPLLIFGAGPVPALGVAGAAWATVASQWLGAAWSLAAVRRGLGLPERLPWGEAGALLVVGRDLFLRTGLLTLFLLLATRAANQVGADAGAAHQVIRQTWMLAAFVLDAYASAAQSLVAGFAGGGSRALARRVAGVACAWGLGTGVALCVAMLAVETWLGRALLPPSAQAVFAAAWLPASLAQPANALAFVTDGVHWGTRDYRFLRNAMGTATALAVLLLFALDLDDPAALSRIWLVTGAWSVVRAGFGALRVWPGLGRAPLAAG